MSRLVVVTGMRGRGAVVTAGRAGAPYTVAKHAAVGLTRAVWLASPEAAGISGQTLVIDGGGIQT